MRLVAVSESMKKSRRLKAQEQVLPNRITRWKTGSRTILLTAYYELQEMNLKEERKTIFLGEGRKKRGKINKMGRERKQDGLGRKII